MRQAPADAQLQRRYGGVGQGTRRHKGPTCPGCGSSGFGTQGLNMGHPSSGLALRPYVKQVHLWYIPVAVVAGTGRPCIPLLTSKRSCGGLEHPRGCETPKSSLGTPQPPLTMPHGTEPHDDVTAQTACVHHHLHFITWPWLKHAALSPLPPLLPAHTTWLGHSQLRPSTYLPNKGFSSSSLLMPTPASCTYTPLLKKHKLKMQYMN